MWTLARWNNFYNIVETMDRRETEEEVRETLQIWIFAESDEIEFFDSEETARKAFEKYCQMIGMDFDEEMFDCCYMPVSKYTTIWTMDNINEYEP